MSNLQNLQKSKRFDLIDKFKIPVDILTIYSPLITQNLLSIYPIYPREIQLNKTNTCDKETSFLDLNIKVIGSNIHTGVYDNAMTSGFL